MQMQLVLPNNYVELEQEEMMYLDGGLYLDDNTIKGLAYSIGISAYYSIPSIIAAIQVASGFIALKLAAIPGGNIIGLLGGAYIAANAGGIAPALSSALIRGKGMDIDIGWWYALPVLNFSAR